MNILDEKNWKNLNISQSIQRFFYSVWEELFDLKVYNTWQVRTSSPASLIQEIEESISITKKVHTHHPNIKNLLEELKELLEKDCIIKRQISQSLYLINNLIKIYQNSLKCENSKDFEYFCCALNSLKNLLYPGIKQLYFNEIKNILENHPNKKKDLYNILSNLGSLLLNEGYSYLFLNQSIHFINNNSPENLYQIWLKYISREKRKYYCYILMKFSNTQFNSIDTSSLFKIFRKNHFNFVRNNTHVTKFLRQDTEATIICMEFDTFDVYSTILEAKNKIQDIFSAIRLYSQKEVLLNIYDSFLIKNENNDFAIFSSKQLLFFPKKESLDLIGSYQKYLKLYSGLQEKNRILINASLRYYDLFYKSNDDELKILNLWISLETMFQQASNDSIITRITSILPTIVSTIYVEDILRETAKDIIKYTLRFNKKEEFDSLFQPLKPNYIDPEKLLQFLTDKENGSKITMLLEYCHLDSLLLFRITDLWTNFFQNKDVFIKKIKSHKMNINWQLKRIYRIRNNIMHQGKNTYDIQQFIYHLDSYFLILMHKILNYLSLNNEATINDALYNIKDNFEYLLLKMDKEDINFQSLYKGEYIVDSSYLLWKN